MPTANLPTSAVLKEVEQAKIVAMTAGDPTFELFPIVEEDTDELQWEQKDNYRGMMAARGLNGEPPIVRRVGSKRWQAEIGYYGEQDLIDETELTKRRKLGTFADPETMERLISEKQDYLLARDITRMRYMVWTLLSTGTYTATNQLGQKVHSDAYTFQGLTASVGWATVATATPLQNFRDLKLKQRGYSTKFNAKAKAYMNAKYVNYLLMNANTSLAELANKRRDVGATINTLADLNAFFLANDLPQVVEYDETYETEAGVVTQFIPDNKVVVIGPRDTGAAVGDICQTRNANNPNMEAGSYSVIVDSANTSNPVPRKVSIHRGWNGGMRIYHPSSICIMTV